MATLKHEVWEEIDESGQVLEGMCIAGPTGDGFRALLSPGARLVSTIEAGSHFEAMNLFYAMYERGPYLSSHPADFTPYP
jgi:hypothetical protein